MLSSASVVTVQVVTRPSPRRIAPHTTPATAWGSVAGRSEDRHFTGSKDDVLARIEPDRDEFLEDVEGMDVTGALLSGDFLAETWEPRPRLSILAVLVRKAAEQLAADAGNFVGVEREILRL